jgi:hypothetical protein
MLNPPCNGDIVGEAQTQSSIFLGLVIFSFWTIEVGSTTRLLDGGIEILMAGVIDIAGKPVLIGFRRCYER